MKKYFWLFLFLGVFPISCDRCGNKDEPQPSSPTTGVSSFNGTWKYDSNVNGGCSDVVGTICEIKDGTATIISVPSSAIPFGFKPGDKMLSDIKQSTSANNYSAIGYTRNSTGSVQDPNLKVDIVVQANGREMIQTYPSNAACNPVQKWVKTN